MKRTVFLFIWLSYVVILISACDQKNMESPAKNTQAVKEIIDTQADSDLVKIDETLWYSRALGAILDFPDEWEGLFSLVTADAEVAMFMIPPMEYYGGMLCFFLREEKSKWEGAQDNAWTNVEIVAESDEYVITMTVPGDEQSAPEYREQYYKIFDQLDKIVIEFYD